MKNRICLPSLCLLILFANATSFAQEASASPTAVCELCPTISVSCASDFEVGKPLEFAASISGSDPGSKRTYTWEVFGGVIAEGQGTPAIRVKVGPSSGAVTATLQVDGLDAACAKTASCTYPIHHLRPIATKFDSYGALSINKEKARLNFFATALKQHPGAQAYLAGYGGRRSRAGKPRNKAVTRANKKR